MAVDDSVRLVLVGHFGYAEDYTPTGWSLSYGGSGYACAVGAGAGDPSRVGVVARIGENFDDAAIAKLGVDRRGALRVEGRAPHLTIVQHTSDERSFESSLGVADTPALHAFPGEYATAEHVHLATMPPAEQRAWLRMLRENFRRCTISVDMFESMAEAEPDACRELCYAADLVFMNAAERDILFADHPLPSGEVVLKAGERGATLSSDGLRIHAPAPRCEVQDTTAAGELLAGAFLSLRVLGVPDGEALQYAVDIASAKVSEFGLEGPKLRSTIDTVHAEVAAQLTDE
jgi:sugar/nucleoside kinase (ribokinase family)